MFHAKDGWYFRRNDDGSVSILRGNEQPDVVVMFDAATWQSIIASVSKEGEGDYRFFVAEKFHGGGAARCRHILNGNFVGNGKPCGLFFDVHYMLDADHDFL